MEFSVEEVRLLRSVVTEIEQINSQYPGVVPRNVMNRYEEVKQFYDRQLAHEEYMSSTSHYSSKI